MFALPPRRWRPCDRGRRDRVPVHPEQARGHVRHPVRRGQDVLVVVAIHGPDHHVLRAAAHRRTAAHPGDTGVRVLDRPVELVHGVRQSRHVGRGDGDVLQAHGRELLLDPWVGSSTDQERVHVVVARDAGVAETLDLVRGDLRDPIGRDVQDRGVIREMDQRRRGDVRQRVVWRQQREPPRSVGDVVILVRRVERECRRPDVLRDRHCLLVWVRAIDALSRLGPDGRHQVRLARRQRNAVIRLARRAERVLLGVWRPPNGGGIRGQMELDLADRARAGVERTDRGQHEHQDHSCSEGCNARGHDPGSFSWPGLGGNQSK